VENSESGRRSTCRDLRFLELTRGELIPNSAAQKASTAERYTSVARVVYPLGAPPPPASVRPRARAISADEKSRVRFLPESGAWT